MEEIINMLLPDEENNSISTLVFMDLEATGLPSFIGKKNVHITEISLIAVDRQEFETDINLRVINKLSLCVRPRTQISHGAMSITGLYNDTLENQEVFDESIAKLFKYFFRRLKPPICLLAHNGNKYDFPLLKAELTHIKYALGPDVFCVDTLEALRSIFKQIPCNGFLTTEKNAQLLNEINTSDTLIGIVATENGIDAPTSKVSPTANTDSILCRSESNADVSDDEIDKLLSNDIDMFSNIVMPSHIISAPDTEISPADIAFRNENTPKASAITSSKQLKRHKMMGRDPGLSTKRQSKSNLDTDVRRKLFKEEISLVTSRIGQNEQSKPVSFSLPKLYFYLFGEDPPVSHFAEADCIALSKVCQQVNTQFLKWIDENSSPFNQIKEMW